MFSYITYCYDDEPKPDRALDIFMPDGKVRDMSILFVHGGGWSTGMRSGYHSIMTALIKKGWICGSLDYRLSGVTALEQLADVHLGRTIFSDKLHEMGHSGDMVLVGSSAGAHLALLEGMADTESCVKGIVSVSGILTFELWDEIFPPIKDVMVMIAGQSYEDNPALYRDLSPYCHINEGTPPICLLDGANEHMFPSELAEAFVEKMRKYGRQAERHVYANAEHGFLYDVSRPCQQKAFADLISFCEKVEN
jgi:acetyl esterase/lipase